MSSLAVYQTFCHRLSVVVRKCEFFAVCILMLIGSLQDFCIILVRVRPIPVSGIGRYSPVSVSIGIDRYLF